MSATQTTASLYELLSRLSATKGLDEMLDEVLSASMSLMEVDMGYLALYDPETHLASRRGLPDSFVDYFSKLSPVPDSKLPPGRAITTGTRVVVPDVYAEEAFKPHISIIERAGFLSMQATPLITRAGQAVGTICTYSRCYSAPPDEALETLDLYARLAADLIERERTNLALELTEKRFRLATTAARVYPWELDFTTSNVWYLGESGQFSTMSDFGDIAMWVHPEDRGKVLGAILGVYQGRSNAFALEHRGIPQQGVTPWYRVSGEVVRGSNGRPERLLGVRHDITERKQTEIELQESEGRFRHLYDLTVRISRTEGLQEALDEILDAVLTVLGANGGHIWLSAGNPNAAPSFAATKGAPTGYLEYVRNLPEEELVGGLARQAARTHEMAYVEDVSSDPVFGRHADVMRAASIAAMLCWPLVGRGEVVLGVLTAYFDKQTVPSPEQLQMLELYGRLAVDTLEREEHLAAQKQSGDALRQALALRNEFLGLVSHELRTPMTVIRGLASVLTRQEIEKHELPAVFRDLRDESERLYWLIENMLRLTRLEAGQRPEAEVLLLHRTLESIVERLRRNFPMLDLRVELPSPEVIVSGIETYLEQVLHNLLQNAAKYSGDRASVDVRVDVAIEAVQIRVSDRGIGVKDTQAVFQAFQREEHAGNEASGMGLGLAVCKALVEAQGGQIWVEKRDGGGSEFCFTLQRVLLTS